jgi:hypothetical protein
MARLVGKKNSVDDVKKLTSGTSPDDDKLPGVTVGE